MYYKGERHAKTYFLLFLQENITIQLRYTDGVRCGIAENWFYLFSILFRTRY